MTPDKIKLLCNGIASIADAVGTTFDSVLEDLELFDTITPSQAEAVREYMENH